MLVLYIAEIYRLEATFLLLNVILSSRLLTGLWKTRYAYKMVHSSDSRSLQLVSLKSASHFLLLYYFAPFPT